jgi:hypothetical protein
MTPVARAAWRASDDLAARHDTAPAQGDRPRGRTLAGRPPPRTHPRCERVVRRVGWKGAKAGVPVDVLCHVLRRGVVVGWRGLPVAWCGPAGGLDGLVRAGRPRGVLCVCHARCGTSFHPCGPSAGRRGAAVGVGPARCAPRGARSGLGRSRCALCAVGCAVRRARPGDVRSGAGLGAPGDPHFSPLVPVARTVGGDLGSQPTNPPLVSRVGTSGENLGSGGCEWREPRLRWLRVARASAPVAASGESLGSGGCEWREPRPRWPRVARTSAASGTSGENLGRHPLGA